MFFEFYGFAVTVLGYSFSGITLLNIINLYHQKFPQPGVEIEEELAAVDLEYFRENLPKLIKAMKYGGRSHYFHQ
ncbi:hypothetical protein [Microcoleus sp.]|uniref:hypothetical protein n=1 Tax=Microcoleus sp. TaxID=44472 RepID=UPI0035937208